MGWIIWFVLLTSTVTTSATAANVDHIGTVTRKVGKVIVLKNPSKSADAVQAPRVKYEDHYFTETVAEAGTEIKLGEVIQTGRVGRARIIFSNGDQINVSTDTVLRIEMSESGKIKAPHIELSQGNFRGVIDSDGPRGNTVIRTRSMVMGVRGTDFFVANRTVSGLSQVSVIRGEVGVKPTDADGDEVQVPAGYSAGVGKREPGTGTPDDDPNALVVEVEKTPPMLLAQIDKFSQIPGMVGGPGEVMIASEMTEERIAKNKKLKELEKKSADSTLKDIKKDDPELYESLQKNPAALQDPDKINARATEKVKKTGKKKPKTLKRFYKKK